MVDNNYIIQGESVAEVFNLGPYCLKTFKTKLLCFFLRKSRLENLCTTVERLKTLPLNFTVDRFEKNTKVFSSLNLLWNMPPNII